MPAPFSLPSVQCVHWTETRTSTPEYALPAFHFLCSAHFHQPSLIILQHRNVTVSAASCRIRCPERKFAPEHRSRLLHGHDCCETEKAFSKARHEKYLRRHARTAQVAVVRTLPRFASDFCSESYPAASSKTDRTGTLELFRQSKRHLSHTLAVRSDSEALLQRFVFAQR